ncbi:MAG: LPXTG cell wall anchor domain-containing protein [Clostridia bacterium]|nr:LPXTG cell wall anchor domain-containing protein [Clostridia bacterium]MDY5555944.1 LPXTG cell wall anchor domain-containing protein [Blautia sp.]
MSDRNRKKNRINRLMGKRAGFIAATALTVILAGGQTIPALAVTDQVQTGETQEGRRIMPDNITITDPVPLSEVVLPASEYGTFVWADENYVPTEHVQPCKVILKPFSEVDNLSEMEGWDEETGGVVGYINVVVNSIIADNASGDAISQAAPAPSGVPDTSVVPVIGDIQAEDITPAPEDINDSLTEETEVTETLAEEEAEISDNTENVEIPVETESQNEKDIFEGSVIEEMNDQRPSDVDENISEEEKEEQALENHTCDGISVNGTDLPWYVQFRVSSGDSYQFTNESDAMIFQSFEFELWDLKSDTEYKIPNGEYVSVTVPVKEGYQYTIEHILDNGATETIIPSVQGNTMVFSTHSFSPFGIAGSKQLVGPGGEEDADETQNSDNGMSAADQTQAVSQTGEEVKEEEEIPQTGKNTENTSSDEDSNSVNTVNTGDTTNILPFVIILVAAVIIIGVIVFVKKKKK